MFADKENKFQSFIIRLKDIVDWKVVENFTIELYLLFDNKIYLGYGMTNLIIESF
jgi:hypothetical protein